MAIKAIIFDLDNTIYSVPSIGNELFASLFELIAADGSQAQNTENLKDAIMRRPFQLVAKEYGFSEELTRKGIALLQELTLEGEIRAFPDYGFARSLPAEKFLVTTGFVILQRSKVRGLNIEADFKEIHIVDPLTSSQTKKEVFAGILSRHGYDRTEVLVVGDDPNSEIRAAQDLGITAVLYDKEGLHSGLTMLPRIADFQQLTGFMEPASE